MTRGNTVLWISLTVVIFAGIGVYRINIETHLLSMYKWGAEDIRAANDFITANVGVGSEFHGYVETKEEERILQPEVMQALDRVKYRLVDEIDLITKVISLSDLVKKANEVFHHDDPSYYALPETKAGISQLLFLYALEDEEDILPSLAVDDYTESRLRIFTSISDSAQETLKSIEHAKAVAREELPDDVRFQTSGRPEIMTNTLLYILDSQLIGLTLALSIIGVTLMVLFRSFKEGLFSLIPNVVPILATMGIMGWLGVTLDVGTAMVACVALGIAVDDTVHLLWNVKRGVAAGKPYETALRDAFDHLGNALVTTTILLCVGFGALIGSQLWTTTYFGVLTAISCLTALLCDLFLAPVLILRLRPFSKR